MAEETDTAQSIGKMRAKEKWGEVHRGSPEEQCPWLQQLDAPDLGHGA